MKKTFNCQFVKKNCKMSKLAGNVDVSFAKKTVYNILQHKPHPMPEIRFRFLEQNPRHEGNVKSWCNTYIFSVIVYHQNPEQPSTEIVQERDRCVNSSTNSITLGLLCVSNRRPLATLKVVSRSIICLYYFTYWHELTKLPFQTYLASAASRSI